MTRINAINCQTVCSWRFTQKNIIMISMNMIKWLWWWWLSSLSSSFIYLFILLELTFFWLRYRDIQVLWWTKVRGVGHKSPGARSLHRFNGMYVNQHYLSLANFLIREGWFAIRSDISSMMSPHSDTRWIIQTTKRFSEKRSKNQRIRRLHYLSWRLNALN